MRPEGGLKNQVSGCQPAAFDLRAQDEYIRPNYDNHNHSCLRYISLYCHSNNPKIQKDNQVNEYKSVSRM